jgi:hypothetical protein
MKCLPTLLHGRGSERSLTNLTPMKLQQFLEHHGVARNPFAEEDAQTDPVFKERCIDSAYHPGWDKIYGDPREPATSVVFGEKGSGKTALRLQISRHLADYNRQHPGRRVFVVHYDDFNPFLDRFRERVWGSRAPEQVLAQWMLWDHMDAILALSTTQLVDLLLHPSDSPGAEAVAAADRAKLTRHQQRDLLLLAACYDQSSAEPYRQRWHHLRRVLRFRTWRTWWATAVGVAATAVVVGLIVGLPRWEWLTTVWPYLAAAAGWLPWLGRFLTRQWTARGIVRQIRVLNRDTGLLRKVLLNFTRDELSGQPLPNKQRTDDRFELLNKLQSVLQTLGYAGIVVLVDRVDEPHLLNGSPDKMRALIWPMLDNKFLKHPGIGFKLLLPIEMSYFIERESREFYQRSRLDKQNVVPSLEWTGEALYDLANARMRACSLDGRKPKLRDMFDETIDERRLIDGLRHLRVPRHLFKFLYRLFTAHCHAHTDEAPVWQIPAATFESNLAVYRREQDAFDRGTGAG